MWTLLIFACIGGDATDTSDTASQEEPLVCIEPTGDWPLQAGNWTTVVVNALDLGCENESGNGMHINVGEENPFVITETEPGCVEVDASGLPMEGTHDGETIWLRGSMELEYGICIIELSAVLEGTMTAEDTFDYQVNATLTSLDESCEIMVGTTNKHTFPVLPCSYSWDGNAWLP